MILSSAASSAIAHIVPESERAGRRQERTGDEPVHPYLKTDLTAWHSAASRARQLLRFGVAVARGLSAVLASPLFMGDLHTFGEGGVRPEVSQYEHSQEYGRRAIQNSSTPQGQGEED